MKVSLGDLRSQLGQPAETFRWSLLFVTQPPMSDGIIMPDDIDIRCESTNIPEYDYTIVPIKIRQYQTTRNSILKPKPITLKVIETTNSVVSNFFSSWQKATFDNSTGNSNNKADLSCTITIVLLDNNNNPMRNFLLEGCILADYKRSILDNKGGEPMKFDITLSWDKMVETGVDLVSGAQLIGTVVDIFSEGKVPEYLKI